MELCFAQSETNAVVQKRVIRPAHPEIEHDYSEQE